MRDRWVAVYLFLVLIQVPLYYLYGRAPLSFDLAMDSAESRLAAVSVETSEEVERSLAEIDRAEAILDGADDHSSRRARVVMARAILDWRQGQSERALEELERGREIFAETHGADSFYVAVLDLRIGEFLLNQGQPQPALEHFDKGLEPVHDHLGPNDSFYIRSIFLKVRALTFQGDLETAADLARANLVTLVTNRDEIDPHFLVSVSHTLQLLTLKGALRAPPEGYISWKEYLSPASEPD